MSHDHWQHGNSSGDQSGGGLLRSRAGFVLIGFLLIGGFLLFTEHRAHVLGLLVWLPVLACPLMHLFMHGGHGGHGGHDDHGPREQ
ncbi:DUF2933 domain-containing protein [Methylosinus sp. LW3]|uniref:DUF2933 domain-containing protein n=1 Tax=Methylosinus sp. LW3 TaxID=107635 RepID=UPI0009FF7710|nr:DUF2933 domain-containing protein [Methylosinus sp. LW3]